MTSMDEWVNSRIQSIMANTLENVSLGHWRRRHMDVDQITGKIQRRWGTSMSRGCDPRCTARKQKERFPRKPATGTVARIHLGEWSVTTTTEQKRKCRNRKPKIKCVIILPIRKGKQKKKKNDPFQLDFRHRRVIPRSFAPFAPLKRNYFHPNITDDSRNKLLDLMPT